MKFSVGDRVRVVKSMFEEELGLEGVVIAAEPATDSSTFNSYTVKASDGRRLEFLEYQLEKQ